ncbi:MAG: HAMP domain-containing protein, partial [Candidatus Rokubacteria bacterium]|nr:HAMP domain-containing protein [Candidatus Rokubacteria bacterium]
MARALSIRARLTVWYTAVVVAILLLVGAASYAILRWHLRHDLDASLLTVARVMRDTTPPGPAAALPPDLDALVRGLLGPEFADALLQHLAPDGRARAGRGRALPLSPTARDNAARGVATFETVDLPPLGPVRLLTMPLVRGGRVVDLLQAAIPLRRTEQALARFVDTLLVLIPLGALLAAGGGFLLARRALRPVDEMTRDARRISAEDLSRRLERRGTADEIDRLADTLNAMLARLEAAFGSMQRFAADAAHELRTPLTALKGGLEVALRSERSPAEYRGVLASSLEEVDQLIRLAEDLLLLSRSSTGVMPSRGRVDLGEIALEAVEAAVRLAKGKGVTLRVGETAPAPVAGEAGALRRALLNLIDNAVKYTPAGGSVEVSGSRGPDGVAVRGEDTGIGSAAVVAARVFGP